MVQMQPTLELGPLFSWAEHPNKRTKIIINFIVLLIDKTWKKLNLFKKSIYILLGFALLTGNLF